MNDLTPEDIVAAREQGDLTALLLMAAGLTPKAPRQRAPEPEPVPDFGISRPGAWPAGTGPSPRPHVDPAECDRALADYRRWLVADRPPAPTRCDCGCTPTA